MPRNSEGVVADDLSGIPEWSPLPLDKALEAVQRVARVALVPCACPACTTQVLEHEAVCPACGAAGCTPERAYCRAIVQACACCGALLPDGDPAAYEARCPACTAAGCQPILGHAACQEGSHA